jgi:hypothetical protein
MGERGGDGQISLERMVSKEMLMYHMLRLFLVVSQPNMIVTPSYS